MNNCLPEIDNGNVVGWFEWQAAKQPDAIAVQFDNESVNYETLKRRADGVAATLTSMNLQPDTRVAVYLEPGPMTAVAILAILKAGYAYVPLSTAFPHQRIAYIINDAKTDVILSQNSLSPSLEGLAPHIIALDHEHQCSPIAVPKIEILPTQTAYILYTSGSSGKPKGVEICHQSLTYYLGWHCRHLRAKTNNIDLPLTASMSFAAGVTQFYTPLILGRTLHIMGDDIVHQPARLFDWYQQHPQFGLYCVPTLWNELLSYAAQRNQQGERLRGPACVLLSGEAVSDDLVQRSFDFWPNINLMNLYGPTEATANCCAAELRPGQPVSLGEAIEGTEIHLITDQQPTPHGEVGELCIAGSGVAKGYLNLPELTKQRFIENQFGVVNTPFFYTGDLARYNDQGELIYLGRKDFQVKIRGFRIECGEVEHLISQHTAVNQTLVTCLVDDDGNKQLVAYYKLHFAHHISMTELRSFVAERLPDYMTPTAFVALDSFPKLSNGKVDRQQLPRPGHARPVLDNKVIAPTNMIQQQVLQIWQHQLKLEGLGIEDNFLHLGGDSLKAATILQQLKERFQVELSYRQFFKHPTPAALADAIVNQKKLGQSAGNRGISALAEQAVYPLSRNQQSLWLLCQTQPNLTAYNMQFSLRLSGQANLSAIRCAIENLLQQHSTLRSVIREQQGEPVIQIQPLGTVNIETINLQHLPSTSAMAQVRRLADEQSQRPFSLEKGPLYHFQLFQLPDERCWLFTTVHHIVFDGRSINIFCQEFTRHYKNYLNGQSSTAQPALQYHDYSAWQAQQLSDAASEKLTTYWQNTLDDCTQRLDFPIDFVRPPIRSYQGAVHKQLIDTGLKQRLIQFCQNEQVTPFMTLLTAFKVLLYRHTRQQDTLVGCPMDNRYLTDAEDLIGFFATPVVIRSQVQGEQSFRQLLAQIKQNSISAFEHSLMPFDKLVEIVKPERNLSHTPLFQVMFGYHTPLNKSSLTSDLKLDAVEEANNAAKCDFVFDAHDMGDSIELRLSYSTQLFTRATMKRLTERFIRLLNAAIEKPDHTLVSYPLQSAEERRKIMETWNETQFNNRRMHPLHQLFEQQTTVCTEQPAVIFGREQLTYGELNRRANQLSRYLIEQGIKRQDKVGVCMSISTDTIVALLAILKMGATYVPLDPYYPKDRIDFIVRDCNLTLIVSQRHLLVQLSHYAVNILAVDDQRDAIQQQCDTNLDTSPPTADELMYLMYTSGSTGKPKGVMVPHQGVSNYVLWMQQRFPLTSDDKVLNKTTINFDISIWEIFLPLISGAQLVLGKKEDLHAPESLAALIQQQHITQIQLVPSALQSFIDADQLPACRSLKRIFAGGEALSLSLQQAVFRTFNGELHNLYGPTEASIYACHWQCRRNETQRSVPIGRPIQNAKVYILDEHMQPAAIGLTGEIYIGGPVLALGYLNRPTVNAEKFISDPWSQTPGAMLFRTGDLARYLDDGNIEIIGRSDRQVKVRGYRIELGEVEHILTGHPDVNHAVVIVREDQVGDVRLVAYLLYGHQQSPENSALRQYLKQKLPDYMIPAAFVTLDTIPLLPNNKVDLKALPKPQYKKSLNSGLVGNYTNTLEQSLARIWETVLESKKFGPEDSFFDVGGHSLLIAKIRQLIQLQLDLDVSNIELFQYPSIRSLARRLAEKTNTTDTDPAPSDTVSEMARRAQMRRRNSNQNHITH